jgi:hypothetical protein
MAMKTVRMISGSRGHRRSGVGASSRTSYHCLRQSTGDGKGERASWDVAATLKPDERIVGIPFGGSKKR